MPIYEYRCNQCEATFSHLFRSLRAAAQGPAPSCPQCQSADVQRLISSVAVLSGAAEESGIPEPPALFGRKELEEKARRERERDSIARID